MYGCISRNLAANKKKADMEQEDIAQKPEIESARYSQVDLEALKHLRLKCWGSGELVPLKYCGSRSGMVPPTMLEWDMRMLFSGRQKQYQSIGEMYALCRGPNLFFNDDGYSISAQIPSLANLFTAIGLASNTNGSDVLVCFPDDLWLLSGTHLKRLRKRLDTVTFFYHKSVRLGGIMTDMTALFAFSQALSGLSIDFEHIRNYKDRHSISVRFINSEPNQKTQ